MPAMSSPIATLRRCSEGLVANDLILFAGQLPLRDSHAHAHATRNYVSMTRPRGQGECFLTSLAGAT